MMVKLTPVLIALSLISSAAFASLPNDTVGSLATAQTFSAYAQHLNSHFNDLNVSLAPGADVNSESTLYQLELLEGYLHGDRIPLKNGTLDQLACNRCICNGCQ